MKKIWVINHYAVPPELGTFIRQFEFAKCLRKKYEIEFFTSSKIHNSNLNIREKNSFIKTIFYDEIKFNFIRNINYSGNSSKRIINMFEFALKLLFLSSKKYKKPDMIYLSSPCLIASFFGMILGKLKKSKIIIEIRDIWPYSIVDYSDKISEKNIIIRILSLIEKIIYKNSDAIIFTIPGGKEYIKDRKWTLDVSEEKIFYVNNGVDLEKYKNSIKELEDKDLNSNKKKFIYTGSIRTANGVLELVKAFEKIKNTEILLLIYGAGNQVQDLEKYIKENGIQNIKYKGRVSKDLIPSILAKSDFNVLSCRSVEKSLIKKYGCSQNKLFEYLASGKPVISSQEYGEYDIVKVHNCGLVKQCLSIKDYQELLEEAIGLPENSYKEMSNNTAETIKEFDWDNLAQKIEEVFHFIEE